jgi:hypothetical protein
VTRDHGYARYRLDSCRCYVCGLARAEYDDRRNRLIAYGQWLPFVPIEETQLRILSLRDIGFGDRSIAALAGVGRKVVRDIRTGIRNDNTRGNPPLTKIRSETAAAIAAIPFDPMAAPNAAKIDATQTWQRLHALIAAGYTRSWIALELGFSRKALQLDHRRVTAANARAVRDLFERVGNRLGPSAYARAEGVRNGWPLPADLEQIPRIVDDGRRGAVVSAAEILADVAEHDREALANALQDGAA